MNKSESNSMIESLISIIAVVKQHESTDVAEWFCGGVEAYLRDGGRLDDHLGIKPSPGQRSLGKSYFFLKRDTYLREAFDCCEDLAQLEEEIGKFRDHSWAKNKHMKQPPSGWSNIRKNIWQAFATGVEIPGHRRLKEICATSSTTGRADVLDLMSAHAMKADKKK